MSQHKLHECNKEGCYLCESGLAYCEVCGGGEASLPSECPGIRMTGEQESGVQMGEIDFVGGEWVRLSPGAAAEGTVRR
jgi:hypothetical protein